MKLGPRSKINGRRKSPRGVLGLLATQAVSGPLSKWPSIIYFGGCGFPEWRKCTGGVLEEVLGIVDCGGFFFGICILQVEDKKDGVGGGRSKKWNYLPSAICPQCFEPGAPRRPSLTFAVSALRRWISRLGGGPSVDFCVIFEFSAKPSLLLDLKSYWMGLRFLCTVCMVLWR